MTPDYAERQRARDMMVSGNREEHQETELEQVDEQEEIVTLLALGGHENFYRDLKQYLKT